MELKEKLLNTGYFIDNEWLDKYCELIENNKDTVKEKCTQKHHILQRAYYKLADKYPDNSNCNIIYLSFLNHLLAHYYLCLCTCNDLDKANRSALFLMLNTCPKDFDKDSFINIYINDYFDGLYNQYCQDNKQRGSINNLGKHLSKETKEKISKSMIGKNGISVICLETLKIYESCSAAAKDIKCNSATISKCCKNEFYTICNLHFRYYDQNIDYSKIEIPKQLKGRKKSVKCVETNIVYESIAEASKQTGANRNSITKCCNNEYKTAGGYHWQYVE